MKDTSNVVSEEGASAKMGLSESDTRAKLINPALHERQWTEDLIKREESAGSIRIVEGNPVKEKKGRTDYILRVRVNPTTQPVAVALIEAKAENLPPNHGLEQAKAYVSCKRLNVPFVIATNRHQFVLFDQFSGTTSDAKPMNELPTPADSRARYQRGMGFNLADEGALPLLTPYKGGEATRRYYQDAAINADNIKYFGEPVYEYTIQQAMDDGYLAVCEIVKPNVAFARETSDAEATGLDKGDLVREQPTDAMTGV